MSEVKSDPFQTAKELAAGCFGGMIQVLVGQPFDIVKVRLQTQSAVNPQYSGVVDCASKILRSEGPQGFYKGTLTPLLGVGACVSIQFAALEYFKRALSKDNAPLSIPQLYLAGAGSGLANSFLSGPIEHVRIRLQVQCATNKIYTGPLDFIKKVYSQHGLAGIYKGQMITFLRELHGFGIYFAFYEFLVQRKMKNDDIKRTQVPGLTMLGYGALSGYILWIFIYPIVRFI